MFKIYKTHKIKDEYVDELIAVCYSESSAYIIVEAFRKETNSQLYYFEEVK